MFDQITLFMIFMMLCFAGIAAMFYFILRGLDELTRELRGERTQLIGIMQSVESSVELLVKAAQLSLKHQAGRAGGVSASASESVQNKQILSRVAGSEEQAQKSAELSLDSNLGPLSMNGAVAVNPTRQRTDERFLDFGRSR